MVAAGRVAVPESTDGSPGEPSLSLLLQRLLGGSPDWSITVDEVWAHAKPPATDVRQQGWKLHVSATVRSAAEILQRCAPILVAAGCQFKIARDHNQVEWLTHGNCPRGNAGKVMTVYPAGDAQAVQLAEQLDTATRGLDGPRVLSDRQFRPGSLVHYRFGAFTGVPHVSHDGEVSAALVDPDGAIVADRREAGLVAPSWATNPFPHHPAPVRSGGVLLDGRYAVREAIRHANRGGVFRATDTVTRRAVVLKQARAHVGADYTGHDVRDRLRNEATILGALSETGMTPEPFSLFEQDGDLFLAEEDLGGSSLRAWVTSGMSDGVVTRPVEQTRQLVHAVALAVEKCHEAGIVVRDLSPNNIVVKDDGRPMLIDLEFATFLDDEAETGIRSGTPGYSAPEQFAGSHPDVAADSHSLGATLLYCFTGEDPYLRPDETLARWVGHGLRPHAIPAPLMRLGMALCATDPVDRMTVSDAVRQLSDRAFEWPVLSPTRARQLPFSDIQPISDAVADDAIDTLIARLLVDVRVERTRVSRRSTFGETTLAANVQHGAAGVLGVMVQAWRARGGDELLHRIRDVADWLDHAIDTRTPDAPVGLYFGWAGPCWALADAGAILRDDAMIHRAVEHALSLDVRWPGPDTTHGTAGLGLTLVKLWQLTADPRLRCAAAAVATQLAGCVVREGDHVSWRTPATAASAFAGTRYHGYAHGTAGIGTFLDAAANLTGDREFGDLADAAALTVRDAAVGADGVLRWGSGPEQPGPLLPHWCNGSSGVATFLVRRDRAEFDADLLDGAARAIVADKWQSGVAYCHGLPGNADLLLDLSAKFTGPYRNWAADLLRLTWDRRSKDAHGTGLTDDIGRITPDFNVGYGGALSALLRLRHGGPRLWMPAVNS
jgi:hypothetical protein